MVQQGNSGGSPSGADPCQLKGVHLAGHPFHISPGLCAAIGEAVGTARFSIAVWVEVARP